MDFDDAALPPEEAIAAIKAEKLRRAAASPSEGIERTERHVVDPSDNPIIRAEKPTRRRRWPRRRRAGKPREEPRLTPTRFFLTISNVTEHSPAGEVREGWFIVRDDKVLLTDAAGVPNGEERKIERNDPLWTARRLLRDMRMRRKPEPNHRPLNYPPAGWR